MDNSIFKKLDEDKTDDSPIPLNSKGLLYLCVGKKRSGKSTLYLNLLESKKVWKHHFNNIFIVSPTAKFDNKLKNLTYHAQKEGKYYEELNINNIETIKKYIEHEKKRLKITSKTKNYFNLLILDDVINELPKGKKSVLSTIFHNQRHYNLTIILVSQTYKDIPSHIRKQADIISFFPTPNKKEIEALQDEYNLDDELFDICFKGNDHPFMHLNVIGHFPIVYRKFELLQKEI